MKLKQGRYTGWKRICNPEMAGFLNFMVLAINQIILHLNKITECLKMTTFKIVFTLDGFFCAETTMHCKVTCILYKKQAHFSQLFCLQVRSVTP